MRPYVEGTEAEPFADNPEEGLPESDGEGEPIAPPAPYADQVPEPIPETKEEVVRRRKEALDALPLPQRLKKTGFSAYYDQHPDRAGVLDAIGFEKFVKLYRKY